MMQISELKPACEACYENGFDSINGSDFRFRLGVARYAAQPTPVMIVDDMNIEDDHDTSDTATFHSSMDVTDYSFLLDEVDTSSISASSSNEDIYSRHNSQLEEDRVEQLPMKEQWIHLALSMHNENTTTVRYVSR
jgi:hypothetical protein